MDLWDKRYLRLLAFEKFSYFGTLCMGQEKFGPNFVGTIYLITKRFWDNLPTEQKVIGTIHLGTLCPESKLAKLPCRLKKYDGNLMCCN